MQKIFNFISNNFPIFVVLLTFILPVVGKMWANIKKQRAEKSRRDLQEQARLDALRTGQREPVTPEPVAVRPQPQRSFQEIAEERQRKLAARAQGAGAPRPSVSTSGTPTRLIRLPGGIVIEVPDETAQQRSRPAQPTSQPTPQTSPQPVQRSTPRPTQTPTQPAQRQPQRPAAPQPRATSQTKPARPPARRQSSPQQVQQPLATRPPHDHYNPFDTGESTTHRLVPDSPIEESRIKSTRAKTANARVDLSFLTNPDRTDLKRAFVMSEVLGQPKGSM